MKLLFVIFLSICLLSCNQTPFNSGDSTEPGVVIQTDQNVYSIVNEQLVINVSFENMTEETLTVFRNGCGFPDLTIEKKIAEKWQESGGPVCIALAVPPSSLPGRTKFSSDIRLFADNIQADDIAGVYRLKFYLNDSSGNRLPLESRLSNSFTIIK